MLTRVSWSSKNSISVLSENLWKCLSGIVLQPVNTKMQVKNPQKANMTSKWHQCQNERFGKPFCWSWISGVLFSVGQFCTCNSVSKCLRKFMIAAKALAKKFREASGHLDAQFYLLPKLFIALIKCMVKWVLHMTLDVCNSDSFFSNVHLNCRGENDKLDWTTLSFLPWIVSLFLSDISLCGYKREKGMQSMAMCTQV